MASFDGGVDLRNNGSTALSDRPELWEFHDGLGRADLQSSLAFSSECCEVIATQKKPDRPKNEPSGSLWTA